MHNDKKEVDSNYTNGVFASIMKEYKNWVLSSKHSVATMDIFCTYLCRGVNQLDDMNLKVFKAHFKVLFKLYNILQADYELTIGERNRTSSSSMPSLLNIKTCLSSKKIISQHDNKWLCGELSDLSLNRPACTWTIQTCGWQKCEHKEANQRRMSLTRNVLLFVVRINQALTATPPPSLLDKKIIVIHEKTMGKKCSGNPMLVTIEVTKAITSSQDLPPINL